MARFSPQLSLSRARHSLSPQSLSLPDVHSLSPRLSRSGHGRTRDRSRSTRLVAPTKSCPFSPSETTNSGRELDWFEPEFSRRRAAASSAQTRCFDCTYSAGRTLTWSGSVGLSGRPCQNFGRKSRVLSCGPGIGPTPPSKILSALGWADAPLTDLFLGAHRATSQGGHPSWDCSSLQLA
ncbi:hypothetical protein Prudu_021529 [Prunus dulcis]|uniref:Uncharacterized protein n=1 Tax=Prunus dulcis TaxID=3755 RepID=A0A4Y1RZ72_PRUDU|nr:hypothetical protein Prudu_021529 [Prunus dulcis]